MAGPPFFPKMDAAEPPNGLRRDDLRPTLIFCGMLVEHYRHAIVNFGLQFLATQDGLPLPSAIFCSSISVPTFNSHTFDSRKFVAIPSCQHGARVNGVRRN
jgi:hypothetical protein